MREGERERPYCMCTNMEWMVFIWPFSPACSSLDPSTQHSVHLRWPFTEVTKPRLTWTSELYSTFPPDSVVQHGVVNNADPELSVSCSSICFPMKQNYTDCQMKNSLYDEMFSPKAQWFLECQTLSFKKRPPL